MIDVADLRKQQENITTADIKQIWSTWSFRRSEPNLQNISPFEGRYIPPGWSRRRYP